MVRYSEDDSSDDYGRPKRTVRRGRKAKRNALRSLGGDGGAQAKVKLKVKTGGANITGKKGAKGGYTITNINGKDANVAPQWQGFGDRELDSDTEEPLVFEEAFILRMPVPTTTDQVKELERFADMVKKREPMDEKDVWFKFMDSRRAVFNLGQTMYNAKLVDLPCLIESQKTHDGKHAFKTADISQMLLVEHPIATEQAAVSADKPFNIDDYIYPHGLAPPLRNVRKRRFKPRINKQAIEIVERQVERLIEQDEEADEVRYELVDESDVQEGEQQRTQAQYMAEFAGVDMSLDPALMGDPNAPAAIKITAATEGDTVAAEAAANQAQPQAEVSVLDPSLVDADGEPSIAGPSEPKPPKPAKTDADGAGDGSGEGEDDEDDDEDDDDDDEDDDEDDDDEDDESDAEGYDSDLAAMIEGEIGGGSRKGDTAGGGQAGPSGSSGSAQQNKGGRSDESGGSDDESDEDDLFGKGRSDDDDEDEVLGDATVKDTEETLEAKRRIRLMADEMKDLDNAVNRKKGEVSRAPNPIIKRRFEDALKKLTQELDMKKAQHLAAQNRLQHFQNEIKKADAAEKEAAMAPTVSASEQLGNASDAPRADPAIVFGDKKGKGPEKSVEFREREASEDMAVDQSPAPQPPPPVDDDIRIGDDKGEEDVVVNTENNEDDIQISAQDFAVPQAEDDFDTSDLFGDDPDD